MVHQFLQFGLRLSGGIERRLVRHLINGAGTRFQQDWVSPHQELWAKHMQPWQGVANVQMLEIGSKEGRSALWLLEHILTDPTSAITCVDLFYNREVEINFEHNVQAASVGPKVIKIKGKSQEVLKVLRQGFYDLIYVDGGHRADEVYTDAVLSWPLLKVGGLMIFDDYLWNTEKPADERPQMAIDQFLQERQQKHVLLHQEYQVIVQKRC
jgi:predicted O-methyltransferase YrrM